VNGARILALATTLALVVACRTMPTSERKREIISYEDVRIETIAEGAGPLVVMLPSRGRDSEDYDEVAAGIARAGFRVLRPQPRGTGASTGPMQGVTLHDFARDVATVIEHERAGPAVIVGHAYGNWVARMTAVDYPDRVRGVVIAAAAAKTYPRELSEAVTKSADPSLSDSERLKYLRYAFFAPGHDASLWLTGWYPKVNDSQYRAGQATRQAEWWSAGSAPMLDLQAELDPFKPREKRNELVDEFGARVTVVVIPDASHALIPEQPQAVVDAVVAWMRTLP
jgi:pimeloyl-ACP methyl ester carboxylesterase